MEKTMHKMLFSMTFVISSFLLTACSTNNMKTTENYISINDNCDFVSLKHNHHTTNSCTPRLTQKGELEFVGIAINIKGQYTFDRDAEVVLSRTGAPSSGNRMMLAGLVRAPFDTLGMGSNFELGIVITAISKTTNQIYSGRVGTPNGERVTTLNLPGAADSQNGINLTKPFNFDLLYGLGLPKNNDTYLVSASLESYKSSVRELSVSFSDK